jgi:hypothetical protein
MKYNGTLTILKLGDSPTELAHVDNATWNSSFSPAQATDKQSNGNMEFLEKAGLREATIDIAGNVDFTVGTGNAQILLQYQHDRENVGFAFDTSDNDDAQQLVISGVGLLSDLSFDTPNEETSTFTGTLTVNGGWEFDS